MSTGKVLLVVIDTGRAKTTRRRIQLPPHFAEDGLDNPALMRRAEREAASVWGVVRRIELVDASPSQKLIPWGQS
ncbi:MAG: hypothetical protein WC284_16405 [Candidimonas sp.]